MVKRNWQEIAVFGVNSVPPPLLISSTLYIIMNLIIPKVNLGTLIKAAAPKYKNNRICSLSQFNLLVPYFDLICAWQNFELSSKTKIHLCGSNKALKNKFKILRHKVSEKYLFNQVSKCKNLEYQLSNSILCLPYWYRYGCFVQIY